MDKKKWAELPVKEAWAYLRANKEKGVKCPCCGQNVKYYKRRFTRSHAEYLIQLYWMDKSNGNRDYIHAGKVVASRSKTGTAEFSKLAYWGLIEQQINQDTKKRTSGMWRITDKGIRVVELKESVPEAVITYLARVMEKSRRTILITQAIGRFDYEQMMKPGVL